MHKGDPVRVRVWEGLKDWGQFTYCENAIQRDRASGFLVFVIDECPRGRCRHPAPGLCCDDDDDSSCECVCHTRAASHSGGGQP